MRWRSPWVRRSLLEDAQRRAQEADWQARMALQEVDRGLVPLVLEPVPDPPMVTLVWQGLPPVAEIAAVWPFEDAVWGGLEREQLDALVTHHNYLARIVKKSVARNDVRE